MQRVLGIYGQLHSKGQTVDDLAGVLPAAYQGQLQYLLMAGGQLHWGRFDRKNLEVEVHEHEEPGDEELLSLAVVYTLTRKGRV